MTTHTITRVLAAVVTASLAVSLLAAYPGSEADAATLKVAVVQTETARGTVTYTGTKLNAAPYYDSRTSAVVDTLSDDFDVTVIGDGELGNLAELSKYDVIVCPRLLTTTSKQRWAMREYVTRGGGFVGSFGVSRWDYVAGRSPHPYEPIITIWQFSDSWDMSRSWEWGEVSELYQVKFNNDPLMSAGYKVGASTASHPIVVGAKQDLGASSLTMTAKLGDYNELVYSQPGNGLVTPILTYDTKANSSAADDAAHGSMAGWAAPYYYGRMVYFGFQLHDFTYSRSHADENSRNIAKALMVNAVRWAGSSGSYGGVIKRPELSANAWFTRGKLYIDETVRNAGNIQLRGRMMVHVYNPSGGLVYSGVAKNQPIPLPPGGSYTYKSWQPSVGTPAPGTWRIRLSFEYYDYFRGGTVTTTRDVYVNSSGSAMAMKSHAAQVYPTAACTPYGTQVAGPTRYETCVELSKQSHPDGVSDSNAVILATGANYPDALAASTLAGQLDAPILLLPPTSLSGSVASELIRLYQGRDAAELYVMGGEGAVPTSIVDAAKATIVNDSGNSIGSGDVKVTRYAGANRYETAAAIARAIGTPEDGAYAKTAIIASGQNYPDALAISPFAAQSGVPILPVLAGQTPDTIKMALADLGVEHCIIVGGTGVVSPAVEGWLESAGHRKGGVGDNTKSPDTRLAGPDRYATGLQVLEFTSAVDGFDDSKLYMATATNWPDALAVGPLAGGAGAPLLLLNGEDIGYSPTVATYLMQQQSDPPDVTAVGGEGAVSDFVRFQVGVALGQ
jgi:putative cell wall-binding protein